MIKYIFLGFFNLLKSKFRRLTTEQIELYNKRLNICKLCTYLDHGICINCGCIVAAKTKVDYDLDENEKSIYGCPKLYW